MNHNIEFQASIDAGEMAGACPVDPDRARKLSAEVLRSKLKDMTTPLVETKPADTLGSLQAWERIKSQPPTGAEVFYFRNTHGN